MRDSGVWSRTAVVAVLTSVTGLIPAAGQEFEVVAWNLRSGEADPQRNVALFEELPFSGVEILALSEVSDSTEAQRYRDALEAATGRSLGIEVGTTGCEDRLALLWDQGAFDLKTRFQIDEVQPPSGCQRTPLAGILEHRVTKQQVIVVVNHFARDTSKRLDQARGTNDWARGEALPIITIGDFNLDWDGKSGAHHESFEAIIRDGVLEWLAPKEVLPSQCSRGMFGGCKFQGMLDFAFVGGPAQLWTTKTEILVRPGDFPPRSNETDHRPLKLTLTIPSSP
jgi:endonuclease/exonuclease/phosphatase family metal-dependent hydrolase